MGAGSRAIKRNERQGDWGQGERERQSCVWVGGSVCRVPVLWNARGIMFNEPEEPLLEPQPHEEEPEGIAVHVRVRPLNSFERSRGDHECVHCDEATQTVRFVTQPASGRGGGGGGVVKALRFDSAVSGSSQVDVFRTVRTQALLQDALQGYAVTVFAYGQTGSGADG